RRGHAGFRLELALITFAIACRREGELDVGSLQRVVGLPKAINLCRRKTENALAPKAPFGDLGRKLQPARALVDGVHVLHTYRDARRVVVTQILANAAQRVLHGDPLRLEEFRFADAGELQQLWGVERTAREDHLAPRADFAF